MFKSVSTFILSSHRVQVQRKTFYATVSLSTIVFVSVLTKSLPDLIHQ